MAPLTPSDVKRWDVGAIHQVFETASNRADTLRRLGDSLGQVHDVLSDWQGEAGDAFRVELGKTRSDIEADGQESKQVATAVSSAEADVRACKAELDDIERAADANGWAITPDWRIDVGNSAIGRDPIEFAAEEQLLQDQLTACKVHAHNADHELATAIRSAVGEVPLASSGGAPGGVSQPDSLQDMLLPPGSSNAATGDELSPAGGAGGKPPSLQDLMMGRQPLGGRGEPQPRDLPDLLGQLGQNGIPAAPPPRLNPAEVERAKSMIRQSMLDEGMPPDQVEARLNEYVANAERWLQDGGPHYVPPEAPKPPPPGLKEGFADTWDKAGDGIKDLIGQGGPGAPGVLESWDNMLKGPTEILQNPLGLAVGEVQDAMHSPSPAYYFGEKAAEGAIAAPGLMFGPEGAGLGELGEIGPGVLDTGPAVSQHALIGLENPATYHSWADGAASDLNYAFGHGGPTADLSRQLADMSTHYVGDNPDRVVLGKWDGQGDGYIGDARANGGIYFDTGDPAYDTLKNGLDKPQEDYLAWQVNEQFLRSQMENGVSRIEYVLPDGFQNVEEVSALRPDSFSAKEIEFLKDYADEYGYQQVGDTWIHATDGQR